LRPPLLASATSLNLTAEVVNGLSLPTIVASLSVTVWAKTGDATPSTNGSTRRKRIMAGLQQVERRPDLRPVLSQRGRPCKRAGAAGRRGRRASLLREHDDLSV